MRNPLQTLLDLSITEKDSRGLRHTPKEIFQQPETWRLTYGYCLQRAPETSQFLEKAGIWKPDHSPIVLLVGAGSSDYIGRALLHLLRRRWHCEVAAVPSTDLLLEMESYLNPERQYLCVSFSRSGESSEGVAVLENALRTHPRVHHLIVTCNADSTMARLCNQNPERALPLVLSDAVNDRGLAMTSSFTNMVIAGQCLAHIRDMGHYRDVLDCMADRGASLVARVPEVVSAIAERKLSQACFVGSAALAAVACESALKLVELTAGKVHTMSQSTLGLRHGPMSAINRDTLLVQFLSSDLRYRSYEIDLLEEISRKQLAGARLVVSGQDLTSVTALADYGISLDVPTDFPDDCRPPLDVIVGQLLGLFSSLGAGLPPDNPSPSGAISRVVSGLKIHREAVT